MRKKLRYDLTPPYAIEQLAEVMTYGSEKHGDRTWENGRKWSDVLACAERHINAIKRGEDFDKETGLLHSSMAMTQLAFLTEYYKIYPQGDDRRHRFLKPPKIGLDIDDTINNFIEYYCDWFHLDKPHFWSFDRKMAENLKKLDNNKEFWLNIPPKIDPKSLGFSPDCYITARSIRQDWTEEWLSKYGFPSVPVFSVGYGKSKVDIAKNENIDFFIDDRFENFVELNENGICCFLFDALHNKKYDVGYRRIMDFNDFVNRFIK